MKITHEVLKIDPRKEELQIARFIKGIVSQSQSRGLVIGLSGGLDSSVATFLCTRAVGVERALALLLPTSSTPKEDIRDARSLVDKARIRNHEIHIDPIANTFMKILPLESEDRLPRANLTARCRMICLYYFANALGYLVVGTGDRSEALIGYFTKYGDGGVDLMPLVHLYKSQVKQMASYLELPHQIIRKPPTPGLWTGQKATDEIPVKYEILDLILYGLFDAKLPIDHVAAELGVSRSLVEEVVRRNRMTAHKRSYPPSMLHPATLPAVD